MVGCSWNSVVPVRTSCKLVLTNNKARLFIPQESWFYSIIINFIAPPFKSREIAKSHVLHCNTICACNSYAFKLDRNKPLPCIFTAPKAATRWFNGHLDYHLRAVIPRSYVPVVSFFQLHLSVWATGQTGDTSDGCCSFVSYNRG